MIASRRVSVLAALAGLAFLAAPLKAQEAPERRVALVIGNSHYQHAPGLANPVIDAKSMSESFRRLGLEVTEGYDLTEKEMRSLLVKFANSMAGAKGAVVFYAGHGVGLDGVNYMLPIDIDLKSPADLDLNGVSVDLVLRQMQRDDRVNVIILDACRDNPFAAVLSRAAVRAAVSNTGLQPIGGDLARGALIAFATDPGKTAYDGPAGAHSPFTAALLRHIEDPATPIETVMRKVRGEVFAATDSKQLPWVNTSLVGDFELNPVKPAPVAPAPREAAATQTTENLLWESAERSRSAEDYKTYLAAFPNGVFAPVAKRRIEIATPETAEQALNLTPTDRATARKALNVRGGGDAFDDDARNALRDWQKRNGFAASGYLDASELARLKTEAAAPPPAVAKAPPPPVMRAATPVAKLAPVAPAPRVRSLAPASKPAPVAAAPAPKSVPRRQRVARAAQQPDYIPEAPIYNSAPSYGVDYAPALAPLIAPSYSSQIHFGGFRHGWSDRRLKRDVCRVGTSASGLPVYTFRYKASAGWYVGAMAQDLLRLKPEAVSKVGAYYQVDYGRIDVPFAPIARPATCEAANRA
jgi:uncharacterized caspase-like protein